MLIKFGSYLHFSVQSASSRLQPATILETDLRWLRGFCLVLICVFQRNKRPLLL